MCIHIHIYAYTYRESIKCRSIDRDRSAQPDVKKQIGFKKSVFFPQKTRILAAMPVFIRKVKNPISPSTDKSRGGDPTLMARAHIIYIYIYI